MVKDQTGAHCTKQPQLYCCLSGPSSSCLSGASPLTHEVLSRGLGDQGKLAVIVCDPFQSTSILWCSLERASHSGAQSLVRRPFCACLRVTRVHTDGGYSPASQPDVPVLFDIPVTPPRHKHTYSEEKSLTRHTCGQRPGPTQMSATRW